eukprot:sb/3476011/
MSVGRLSLFRNFKIHQSYIIKLQLPTSRLYSSLLLHHQQLFSIHYTVGPRFSAPRFSGHPDLVTKTLSPEDVTKSGSDCSKDLTTCLALSFTTDGVPLMECHSVRVSPKQCSQALSILYAV